MPNNNASATDQSIEDWNASIEADELAALNYKAAHSSKMSLGTVLDGYYGLSPVEQQRFLAIIGLGPKIGLTATHVVGGGESSKKTEPKGPAPGSAPVVSATGVPTGLSVPEDFFRTAQPKAEVRTTKDPKTGKTYRVQPKAVRTQEFLGLQNAAEKAKNGLHAFLVRRGYVHDPKSKQTKDAKTGVVIQADEEYASLLAHKDACIKALNSYKKSHPAEFTPPPFKGKGKKVSDQGSDKASNAGDETEA